MVCGIVVNLLPRLAGWVACWGCGMLVSVGGSYWSSSWCGSLGGSVPFG